LELPFAYAREVESRLSAATYDVIELNQPHAYLAARRHKRRRRAGLATVFVNRSHGHEVRSDEALEPWRQALGAAAPRGMRKIASAWVRKLLFRQWDQISRDSDGFVVSCTEDARFLAERYEVASERIGIVTQGCTDAFLSTPAAPWGPGRTERMIYVGQLAFFKAPALLALAVAAVLEERPSARMTWICSAAQHGDARALMPLHLQNRVDLLDWMPQGDLIRILDEHGVFLFPSLFEGFGKAPLEAMARGLCVVASDTGGMRDYIESGRNGLLIDVGDHAAMARAVLEVMTLPERAAELGLNARQTALGHTWDRCAQEAEVFYRSLLESSRRANSSVSPPAR
jgi:glycosyltransferase involved in cell wall biosynthesis